MILGRSCRLLKAGSESVETLFEKCTISHLITLGL